MPKVLLRKIKLSNWKAQNSEVEFFDTRTIIRGENGSGKSSLMHAWIWLLTGYTDATSAKNSDLFDNTQEISPETPAASVKAWVLVDDREITIERIAKAKFTRQKGESEWIKAPSDVYTYKIDDIEYKATDFSMWLDANICPSNMLKFCLSGEFFSTLAENDKDKARKVLEPLVGPISIDDFNGDYSNIAAKLEFLSVEQIAEQATNGIRPLNKRLTEIPALIDKLTYELSSYDRIDFDKLYADIQSVKSSIESIDNDMLYLSRDSEPLRKERDKILMEIESMLKERREKEIEYESDFASKVKKLEEEIKLIDESNKLIAKKNSSAKLDQESCLARLETAKAQLNSLQIKIELLRRKNIKVKESLLDKESEYCKYCGNKLPDDKLEEIRASFEKDKKQELESIVNEGKILVKETKVKEAIIEDLKKRISQGPEVFKYQSSYDLEQELFALKKGHKPFSETESYSAFSTSIESLRGSLPILDSTSSDSLKKEKSELMQRFEELNRTYGLKKNQERIEKEIEELKKEQRTVGQKKADLELVSVSCSEYIEERAMIISNRVNEKLCGYKIQMFSNMKNGHLCPDCVITDDMGVRFSTLNNSSRLKANIEMQILFCNFFGIDMPVMVDEASVFTTDNLPQSSGNQYIYFYASDVPYLTIER